MKMIKKFSAFICIICIITSVSFAYDRSNAFHSNDYFTNDLQYVNSIQSYFDTYGMFTSVAIRPNVIYGWNYVIGISLIIPIILLNLVIGFSSTGIDNFGHIGGLVGGVLGTMAIGIEGKTTTTERINGIILSIIYIALVVYMGFIYTA